MVGSASPPKPQCVQFSVATNGKFTVATNTRILRVAHAEDSTPGDRYLEPAPPHILFNFHYGPAWALGILATGTSERGGEKAPPL